MKISLNWLKDFVQLPPDPRELKRTLTNVGVGVESISSVEGDWSLEAEITTNRPDCLSHYGIARETATAYRVPLKKFDLTVKEVTAPAAEEVSIEIRNPELCARYCGRVVRNVQVKPSPEWLVARLAAVGVRSINNVADVTNYVLMELGHPLHAFDLSRLRQHKIIVRRAKHSETLKTLDGIGRKLTEENLVIADAERAVALAGVMGGEESEITDVTKSVLIESAWFDPLSVRRTAKSQGLHTEASHRFERGADIEMAPLALDRASLLIKELAGGEILQGMIDVYPRPRRRETLNLRRSEIRRVLGADLPWEDVERILRSLAFAVSRRGPEAWAVTPPSFRLDVSREVDLIEEVARHYGYDRLPSRLVPAPPRAQRDARRERELELTRTLVSLGYREIVTSSLVDPEEGARFSTATPITIENPLSQEAKVLRTSSLPSMVRALRWNLDRGREDMRFFEAAKVYWAESEAAYREHSVLSLGLAGHRHAATVDDTARESGFLDIKGDVETLLDLFDIGQLSFATCGLQPERGAREIASGEPGVLNLREERYPEIGFGGEYRAGSNLLAAFGRLADDLYAEFELRRPVWLAEIDLELLLKHPLKSKSFLPFSKFPSVERDFSLVIPAGVCYGAIAEALSRTQLPELRGFAPADVFRGGAISPGDYSLLLRATFESQDHTLTGDEITAASEKLLDALAPLGVRLRRQEAK